MRARGAAALPDEVGLHAHDRVAAAHLAAGDAFEEEAVLARLGQLQHQRDRRVEVGDEAGPDHLVAARGEAGGEVLDRREELHRGSGEAGEGGLEQRLVHRHPGLVAQRRGVEREEVAAGPARGTGCARCRGSAVGLGGGVEGLDRGDLGQDHPVAVAVGDGRALGGGEDVGDELGRRALGGLAAGERAGAADRAVEALGEVGEGEAALELGRGSRRRASAARRRCAPRASRRRRGRGSRRAGSPRAGRSCRRAGWRGRRRRARRGRSPRRPRPRARPRGRRGRRRCRRVVSELSATLPSSIAVSEAISSRVAPPAMRSWMCAVSSRICLRAASSARALGEVGLGLLEGDGLRRHDRVDAVERRAERRGDRADDARLGGAEDGVARLGGERVGGDDALVDVGGLRGRARRRGRRSRSRRRRSAPWPPAASASVAKPMRSSARRSGVW